MSIVVENLSFVYNPKTNFAKKALEDISITINDGEFIGVIGHTGSGKSTFVQHLNGLIKVQSGRIIVDGTDISKKFDYKKLRSTVGMVFQYPEYQLFDSTVAKDIAFGPKNLGLNQEEINARVREAMSLVGLNYEEIAERSPFEISGGQKRRAALAGVIAMRPKILILDEPTAGLDPKGKQDILSLILNIQKMTTPTVIMVSHNMDEIYELCDKIAVLKNGSLKYFEKPEVLLNYGEELESMGLDLPTGAKIAANLRARGKDIGSNVFKTEDLINGILNKAGIR